MAVNRKNDACIPVINTQTLVLTLAKAVEHPPDDVVIILDLHHLISLAEGNLAKLHLSLIGRGRVQRLL